MQNIKFFFIISIIFLSGCERHNERILQLLQSKDIPPYELLSTLDSINNTQNLSTEDRYDYTFLKTIARYKLKKIQAIDTLLHKEVAYYDEKEDTEKSAFLLLCIGQAYRQARLYEQADLHYIEAATKAEKLTDQMLMLYIYYERGSLYSMLNDKEGAVQLFESMVQLARKDSLLKKQLETTYPFLDASDALLYLGEYKKATQWYQKIYEHVVTHADSITVSEIVYKMAYSLYKQEQLEASQYYISLALKYCHNQEMLLKNLFLLASIYSKEHQPDKLKETLSKAKEYLTPDNIKGREIYYWLLGEQYSLEKKYPQALEAFKHYDAITDTTWVRKSDLRMKRMNETYKLMKAESKNLRLQKQNLITVVIGLLIILCIGLITLYFYLRAQLRYKQYVEVENFNLKLNALLTDSTTKLQELISHNLHVTKQLSKLKAITTPKNEEFIKQYYQLFSNPENPDSQEWENIYFAASFLHNNFKDKLTAAFPQIAEDDIKMCCLSRIGFNTNEIAFAMNLSPHTIHKRKTALRKKLDMPEGADIIEFLESNFK